MTARIAEPFDRYTPPPKSLLLPEIVDVLIEMPDRKRQAVAIADRYLVDHSEVAASTRPGPIPLKKAGQSKAVQ